MVNGTVRFWIVIGMVLVWQSCKVYSFTGANIPAGVGNFSVELFVNRANNGPASLPQVLTDRLKLKMQTEAGLKQTAAGGDVQFSGVITSFFYTNEAPVAGAVSGLNKLTISIQVTYENTKDENDKWTETFTRFAQFSSAENISSVEDRLITEINNQLVDDIFQRALVKW